MENEQDLIKAEEPEDELETRQMLKRRDFLSGLGKWSAAVIGVVVGGALLPPEAAGWVNSRGSWVNGGGGGGWVNRKTTWVNGGGGGAGWVNRSGGGGGSWVN